MSLPETFQTNQYVYVPNLLNKDNCQEYVSEFKKLIEQGLSTKDAQAPLSHSVGKVPLFDSLLEQLTPSMERITGKKLYPTYAYARWYAPGDELKIHKDRPSCEISATITLGFEGDQWPIYMGHDFNKNNGQKIDMHVGDAVIYKGCELFHWREKYVEGQWQAQVFIHYVDQDGPYAEFKYDKRESLAHHEVALSKTTGTFLVKPSAFSKQACKNICEKFDSDYRDKEEDAYIRGNKNENIIDKSVRDCKRILLPIDVGLGATLLGMGIQANNSWWKFNITHSNQTEYLRYDKNGIFTTHMDSNLDEIEDINHRKITALLFLNDDYEGGKFYIQAGSKKIYPSQNTGDVVFFPSFILHGVEPITSGIRRTVVTWLLGPYFK